MASRQTVSAARIREAIPTSTTPKLSPTSPRAVPHLAAEDDTKRAESNQSARKKRARLRSSSLNLSPRASMAEPSAKRSRRTDSAAMWENDRRDSKGYERESRDHKGRDRDGRHEDSRTHGRDERRRRSRSRDTVDRRRERSRSRERERGELRSRGSGRDRDKDRDRDGREGSGRDRDKDRDRDGREGRDRRDRERTASRERHRARRDDPPSRLDRQRTRSRSPARNGTSTVTSTRTRSPPRAPRGERPKDITKPANGHKDVKPTPSQPSAKPPVDEKAGSEVQKMEVDSKGAKEDEDPEDAMIRKMMGFGGFRTTKNTKVPGNDVYGVRKEKKTEYRQYMNRVGGFNRPLSPSRE